MEKSLVVQGKSLEDALNKAAVLLHCDKETVAYEILQEPKSGRYGQPEIPCKLRVVPVAAAHSDNASEQQSEDDYPDVPLPCNHTELGALSSATFLQLLSEALAAVTQTERTRQPKSVPDACAEDADPREVCGDVNLHTTGDIRHEDLSASTAMSTRA